VASVSNDQLPVLPVLNGKLPVLNGKLPVLNGKLPVLSVFNGKLPVLNEKLKLQNRLVAFMSDSMLESLDPSIWQPLKDKTNSIAKTGAMQVSIQIVWM